MYLNILLKRKTEQTHNFPYNASAEIKTDKDHIHRGFKDHKGLSYAFDGVNYSIDNKKKFIKDIQKIIVQQHLIIIEIMTENIIIDSIRQLSLS